MCQPIQYLKIILKGLPAAAGIFNHNPLCPKSHHCKSHGHTMVFKGLNPAPFGLTRFDPHAVRILFAGNPRPPQVADDAWIRSDSCFRIWAIFRISTGLSHRGRAPPGSAPGQRNHSYPRLFPAACPACGPVTAIPSASSRILQPICRSTPRNFRSPCIPSEWT